MGQNFSNSGLKAKKLLVWIIAEMLLRKHKSNFTTSATWESEEIFVTPEVLSNILRVLSNTGDNTNSTKNVTGFVLHTYVADLT